MEHLKELPFRGERNYVHSSHLFERLTDRDPNPTNIDFTVHRPIYFQCDVSSTSVISRKEDLVSIYKSSGQTSFVYESDRPVTQRVYCNEREICSQYELRDHAIEFNYPPVSTATFIESIVAAYKLILQDLYPDNGQYLFARLIQREIPKTGITEVRHQRQMGPNFYQGELRQEGKQLGSIFFGLNHE